MEMKGIKQVSFLALILLCVVFTAGCFGRDKRQGDVSEKDGSEKLKVVTTIFPYYDFVRQIAGDKVELRLVVPAGMDTHSFEPTAEDMVAISEADVFIYNGGEMENWVSRVLSAADAGNLRIETMMEQVDTLEEEIVEGMSGGESGDGGAVHGDNGNDSTESVYGGDGGEVHNETEADEHVWTSPINAKLLVSYIEDVLVEEDSVNRDFYNKNAAMYIDKLDALDKQISEVVSKGKRQTLVFADRFPLRYFTEEYNLSYSAAFPGCSADIEPSADTIAVLIDKAVSEDIPAVLKIELTSSRVADVIADAAETEVETFYTCHNVTPEQFAQGISYVELMEHNIEVLKKALY